MGMPKMSWTLHVTLCFLVLCLSCTVEALPIGNITVNSTFGDKITEKNVTVEAAPAGLVTGTRRQLDDDDDDDDVDVDDDENPEDADVDDDAGDEESDEVMRGESRGSSKNKEKDEDKKATGKKDKGKEKENNANKNNKKGNHN